MTTKYITNLSGNSVSSVWIEEDADGENKKLYKKSPKYLTDNEIYALQMLQPTGFVPEFAQIDDETICMEIIKPEKITEPDTFKKMCFQFMNALRIHKLRHGDLTRPHILPVNNSPIVIDFAESRMWDDPRPNKRRETDEWWMQKTMEEILNEE